MSNHITVICLDCQYTEPYSFLSVLCPRCGSQWREACYDLTALKQPFPDLLVGRPFDLWRYHEALPVTLENSLYSTISLGEGGTPLIHAAKFGSELNLPNIFIKDERQGPTASFKDRQGAVTMTSLKEAGVDKIVLASTGNVALSYSAYAVRAGIQLFAFLPSAIPSEKLREITLYGTQVMNVSGSYDQAKQLAAEYAHQHGLYLERGARSISSVEGMKTIAYEIAEQVTRLAKNKQLNNKHINQNKTPWSVPDWYFQSVSGGIGPLGVQKGFIELFKMGLTDRVPAIACIQADGCSPMVTAWKNDQSIAKPLLSTSTRIFTLATADPGHTYTVLYQRIKQYGGIFESVTDEESFQMVQKLARLEGISVEPAAAVAFSGLVHLVRIGLIKPNDVVVINCTGHSMSIEERIYTELVQNIDFNLMS